MVESKSVRSARTLHSTLNTKHSTLPKVEMNLIQVIAIYAIPVVLAITLHEAAHGYIAMRFGDMTAYAAGRVSLNPIKHIDPVGTVALPLVLLALAKLIGGSGM